MPTPENFKKFSVLFIGGFSVPRDGSQGGQIFACRSLISSPLAQYVQWSLIDSTQRTNPPPNLSVRIFDGVRRVLKLCWHLCFSRIDVVLIFSALMGISIYEKGLMCILAKSFGKRVVLSTRSHPSLPNRVPRFFQRYVKLVCKFCDVIVCQSQLGQQDMRLLFDVPPGKLRVIPNWIDGEKYFATEDSTLHSACPPRKTRIVYVGWLDPIKGLPYLLSAIAELARQRDDFELVLYGGGVSELDLKQQSLNLGIDSKVNFAGWISNEKVPGVLRAADIFVFPTLHEGMPNSLLQAMACGLPVITTRVTSIPEIVVDQINGLLVAPQSPSEIATALTDLLEHPEKRRRMGSQNRHKILSEHTIGSAWPKLASVLGIPMQATEVAPQFTTMEESESCAE